MNIITCTLDGKNVYVNFVHAATGTCDQFHVYTGEPGSGSMVLLTTDNHQLTDVRHGQHGHRLVAILNERMAFSKGAIFGELQNGGYNGLFNCLRPER